MQRANVSVLAVCLAVLVVVVYSGRQAMAGPATDVSDLEQVRGMGNAFTLYEKKYHYFPALTDVGKTKAIKEARAKGNCLAMKLLLAGGFVDDATLFFSPRTGRPDAETLKAVSKEMDPVKDTTWACTYAYDAGHSSQQGATVFFGTPKSYATQNTEDIVHALSCSNQVKSIEANTMKAFLVKAKLPGGTETKDDDIYADDSETLKYADSWLQSDSPVTVDKK
ncbi:MAG TPA: hypothetical protein VL860_06370 [Planctomycetota bacterium]|nr:hypothetical protein [Planctomycetota bacterium]